MHRPPNSAPLIAVVMMAWLSSNASAADADTATYANAGLQFQHLVARATRDTDMPRLTNPQAAKLITTLSDIRLLSSRQYQMKDMSELMDVCDQSNKAVMSYVLFDMKAVVDAKADPQQLAARLVPLMEKNTRTFQNELGQLQPFLLHCLGKEVPLVTEFVRSLKPEEFTDVRRAGLQQVRNGMFNAYYGALGAAGDLTYAESYRTRVLQALAEVTPLFASVLQLQARKQIAGLAASNVMKTVPLLKDALQKIVAGMSDPRCDTLCAL